MFSASGYSFSYEQVPEEMKSVVRSLWQLTDAFGNLILLLVAKLAIYFTSTRISSFFQPDVHWYVYFYDSRSQFQKQYTERNRFD